MKGNKVHKRTSKFLFCETFVSICGRYTSDIVDRRNIEERKARGKSLLGERKEVEL